MLVDESQLQGAHLVHEEVDGVDQPQRVYGRTFTGVLRLLIVDAVGEQDGDAEVRSRFMPR